MSGIRYRKVSATILPIPLLLEADPSISSVRRGLRGASCFAAEKDEVIIGACVVKSHSSDVVEIVNLSIEPEYQRKGIGTRLLRFVLRELQEQGCARVELGTGSFGHQLVFYQRLGFRVELVLKDYFLRYYSEPVFERGLQHKDMLRLGLCFRLPLASPAHCECHLNQGLRHPPINERVPQVSPTRQIRPKHVPV